ncbi:S10 family serine carboxypeptidase-like protein [Paraburkholderia phenazinium]|uniref:Carboxypeptidase C (Cathepsin A) n=1 Tax=Paraburkholderia phenazinium TaxID=60549 RepID=A0A1G8JJ00_9BURK|nr:peptidase S10 [Paraburkholderia phenazinium]SDI31043.1 Carboxypeptidase C (cathepsin A) [Paraburkholderia phenazinium]
MKETQRGVPAVWAGQVRRIAEVALAAGILATAGCGGGVSGSNDTPTQADQTFTDPVAYSPKGGDSLSAAQVAEKAAITHHQWSVGGTTVNYTTTTGHLTASDPNGNPQATMSYVAYTAPSTNGAPRPVTFFYNGGPGSSSVWLRLGSFAPTRVATPDPQMTNWPNFPLVDNQESLIDTTDMVFIDPPGTGLSEAIAPNTNQTFWGADPDVRVMRDFIQRYLTVNNRNSSPIYLYGESYGTPRTNMLALSLESAGVHLTGIVLQSSILNYFADVGETNAITNSNAADYPIELKYSTDSMIGYFVTYAQVAAYFNQVSPAPTNLGAYAQQIQNFVTTQYASLSQYGPTNNFAGSPVLTTPPVFPSNNTIASWSSLTNVSPQALNAYFGNAYYGTSLVPGSTIGRYDGRVLLPSSDPRLVADGDPSDILISQPFTTALATQMPAYLGYNAPNATYQTLNNDIIGSWDFSHGGQAVPDTIPDLLAALTLNPQLKVLSENGYHDLATPYFLTENQLARLQTVSGLNANLQVTFYPGGHMIYLDNNARPQMKADLKTYFSGTPIGGALSLANLPAAWSDESPAGTPTLAAMKVAP